MNKYPQYYVDGCRANTATQLSTCRELLAAAGKGGKENAPLATTIQASEAVGVLTPAAPRLANGN